MERMNNVHQFPKLAAGLTAGTTLVPLRRPADESRARNTRDSLTMVCKSGKRAEQGRQLLVANGFTFVDTLEHSMDASLEAKKPVGMAERRSWSIERQVHTITGSLVVITLVLGYLASSYFFLGTGLVGAGLASAGVSDTCVMGQMLARLPWNRAKQVAV